MAAISPTRPGPLALTDREPIRELHGVLEGASYDGEHVRAALGAESHILARRPDVPLLRRRLRELGPLGTLTSLFVLGTPVESADLARAIAPLRPAHLEELGLVSAAGDSVVPRVRLIPHDDVLIASDIPSLSEAADHVAGIHGPSVTLSHLTVRRRAGRALDVGTGCGIQAVLASRHSDEVTATDLNERALSFAAFNLILNGAGNVELRAGSFFEPVDGERYDLVTCNPPYVISPETAYLFRDSGLEGDTVSREVVRAAPGVLAEGGFASMLVSWAHPSGEDWSAPLRRWVEGSGCDALLLYHGTQDPLTHAGNWTRDRYGHDAEAFDGALARWLDYLDRLGITGIAYGGVVLRRRTSGSNWVRAHRLPASGLKPAGGHIERIFEAQDVLAGLAGDRALLDERFALAERSLVEQRVVLSSGAWVASSVGIELLDGLGFSAGLDAATAALLAELDGRRTLSEVADALARREHQEPGTVADGAVQVIRGMLELGLVERVAQD